MNAKAKSRRHNYRAASKPSTVERQAEILEWLQLFDEGLTVRELGDALGCSRQLALYHLKKLAASGAIVLQLEQCRQNAGLRFRAWNESALMGHYVRKFSAPRLAHEAPRRAA